ncbi:MAG: filamentous hemagglutinin N-terminal domain-containing protein [Cyanobacteria bacterium P01_C01_bin.118]
MTWKLFYLFVVAAPLWIPGFHRAAIAQALTNVDLPITPPTATATTPSTNIQPATPATSVVQQANEFTITGGQVSGGTNPNVVHQFQNFDLTDPDIANFVVSPNIANVISLIDSSNPSTIDGLLKLTSENSALGSNANLFLVNPAGIIFGENVILNLPGDLTATTSSALLFDETYLLSIDGTVNTIALPENDDKKPSTLLPTIDNLTGDPTGYFLLSESPNASNQLGTVALPGNIENQGTLEVTSQSAITFISQYIQNEGNLVAPGGEVNLIAHPGDSLLRLQQPGNILALDVIPADAIAMLSPTAGLPFTSLAELLTANNEESATQIVVNPDGSQTLAGASSFTPASGTVLLRGTIDVSTTNQSQSPGQVNVFGRQINMIGGAINANGSEQGGTVSIGGMPMVDDFRAAFVVIGRGAEIAVNAPQGFGGSVNIWADDTVQFYGSAAADGKDPNDSGTIKIEAGQVIDIRQ